MLVEIKISKKQDESLVEPKEFLDVSESIEGEAAQDIIEELHGMQSDKVETIS